MAQHKVDFTNRMMNDMEPELLAFIKQQIGSFIRWDIVKFFHQNPHAADTAANIAVYIGRDLDAVQAALEGLTTDGLLNQQHLNGVPIYTTTSDETIQLMITKFIESCADRHFRVKTVYHILHTTH